MVIVDAHCHVSPYWYEPVDSLLHQMDRNGVTYAVLIQYLGQYDNEYQFECVRLHPDRFASVVLVDPADPDAVIQLERLADQGASGVRLRPETRSPGDDSLALWRKASELSLPVSCCGTSAAFAAGEFAQLIKAFPNLPIVLEHLGSLNHPDGEPAPFELRRKVFSLARFPNVYVKLHGLGEFCQRATPVTQPFPFKLPIPPILEMAYEAFGPQRMMWGSDYPPVSGREGYRNALRLTLERFSDNSEEDQRLIFGETALQVFWR